MATHSSTLAWKIPWMVEPDRLQSVGSVRVGHDLVTSLSLFTFMLWRRKWQPTPVFLPGESQGWGSLVGCRLWGFTESDTTEATQQQHLMLTFLLLELRFYERTFKIEYKRLFYFYMSTYKTVKIYLIIFTKLFGYTFDVSF